MQTTNINIIGHKRSLNKADYRKRNGHTSRVFWLTGLSGSGKSTLAHSVEEILFHRGWYTYLLDGDNIRTALNKDLGFSDVDRHENIRRIGEVAKLFVDAGVVVFAAFISPFAEDRARVRALFEPGEFIEVYLKCDLAVCEQRDTKGLYRMARAGSLPEFTGIDSPYEEPTNPELIISTDGLSIVDSVTAMLDYIYLLEEKPLEPCR